MSFPDFGVNFHYGKHTISLVKTVKTGLYCHFVPWTISFCLYLILHTIHTPVLDMYRT